MFLCKQDKNQITSLLDNRAFLGYHAANSGNFLPTFRDNLSVPTSGFKNLGITQKSSSSQPLRRGSLKSHTSLLYDIIIGLINCRTQLSGGYIYVVYYISINYMFRLYGHLQVDRLTTNL